MKARTTQLWLRKNFVRYVSYNVKTDQSVWSRWDCEVSTSCLGVLDLCVDTVCVDNSHVFFFRKTHIVRTLRQSFVQRLTIWKLRRFGSGCLSLEWFFGKTSQIQFLTLYPHFEKFSILLKRTRPYSKFFSGIHVQYFDRHELGIFDYQTDVNRVTDLMTLIFMMMIFAFLRFLDSTIVFYSIFVWFFESPAFLFDISTEFNSDQNLLMSNDIMKSFRDIWFFVHET